MTSKFLLAAVCLTAATTALAAKPTSITFSAEGTAADGSEYATYIVKCSDGNDQILTAWDQRRKWCVGEASQENCDRKQIRAAKLACG